MDEAGTGAADGLSLADQLSHISRDLLAEPTQEPTLDRVVQVAVDTVPSADECGISLRRSGQEIDTAACSSELVQRLDDAQYKLGEGPCLQAVWAMDTYLIDDTRTETRWPAWTPFAAGLGIGSVLSVRVETAHHVLGSLNLYAHQPRAFDHTDIVVASIYARHAANALDAADRADQLHAAMRTRQSIGVAEGMLMQRYGLTLDQSFEVLRRYSQDHNIKVRDLAIQMIQSGRITDSIEDTLNPT